MVYGSRPSGSIFDCPKSLRVNVFDCRLYLGVFLLFLSTCQIRGETLSPELGLVYQQAHPAVILGLDEVARDPGSPMKRLSSFMPMRGRRGPGDYPDNLEDKRGSSFLPSRGKKDQDEGSSLDIGGPKRASAFMAMRGRRPDGQQPLDGHFYDSDLDDEESKRGSFMPMRGRKSSFMPMRGRKWSPDSEDKYYGIDDVKRASFMPMRGRKKAFYSKGGNKRLNSFMPMRGKKDSVEDDEDNKAPNETKDETVDDEMVARALEAAIARDQANLTSEDKRGSSFFGMRGKRQAMAPKPSSGTVKREAFFASRGKRSSDTKLDNGQQPKSGVTKDN